MKKFLTALEKHETNAVVVAGGDGTLLEVNIFIKLLDLLLFPYITSSGKNFFHTQDTKLLIQFVFSAR